MPSKSSSSATKPPKSRGPTKEELEAINSYLKQKPDFDKLIQEAKANPTPSSRKKEETEYDRKTRETVNEVIQERKREAQAKQAPDINMPVQPKEEEAGDSMLRTQSAYLVTRHLG